MPWPSLKKNQKGRGAEKGNAARVDQMIRVHEVSDRKDAHGEQKNLGHELREVVRTQLKKSGVPPHLDGEDGSVPSSLRSVPAAGRHAGHILRSSGSRIPAYFSRNCVRNFLNTSGCFACKTDVMSATRENVCYICISTS